MFHLFHINCSSYVLVHRKWVSSPQTTQGLSALVCSLARHFFPRMHTLIIIDWCIFMVNLYELNICGSIIESFVYMSALFGFTCFRLRHPVRSFCDLPFCQCFTIYAQRSKREGVGVLVVSGITVLLRCLKF